MPVRVELPNGKTTQIRFYLVQIPDAPRGSTRYRAVVDGVDVGGDTERDAYKRAVENFADRQLTRQL